PTRKRPSEPDRTTRVEAEPPVRVIRRRAASGRGAQPASGGTRSTGQVGPASTRPTTPEWLIWPLAEAQPQARANATRARRRSDFRTTLGYDFSAAARGRFRRAGHRATVSCLAVGTAGPSLGQPALRVRRAA